MPLIKRVADEVNSKLSLFLQIPDRALLMHAVGIDIGGTKIAGALVDKAGKILKELRVPSPIDD